MNLSLVTAPVEEPVSLADAKAHLRKDDDDEDLFIGSLIKAARQHAETYTRRQFITATWRFGLERFPPWEIVLPLPPLQSVSAVNYVDEAGATQTVASGNYLVNTLAQPAVITPAYGLFWPLARDQMNAVTIDFVAGYGLAAAVPETIKQAIRLMVAHWFENREAINIGNIVHALPLAVDSLLMSEQWGSYP